MAFLSSSLCLSASLHHAFLPRPQPAWPDPGTFQVIPTNAPLSSLLHLQQLSTQHDQTTRAEIPLLSRLLKFPPALGDMSLAPFCPDQMQTTELSNWHLAANTSSPCLPSGSQTHPADITLTLDWVQWTLWLMEPHPSLPFLFGWARSSWASGPAPKLTEVWNVYRASWKRRNT